MQQLRQSLSQAGFDHSRSMFVMRQSEYAPQAWLSIASKGTSLVSYPFMTSAKVAWFKPSFRRIAIQRGNRWTSEQWQIRYGCGGNSSPSRRARNTVVSSPMGSGRSPVVRQPVSERSQTSPLVFGSSVVGGAILSLLQVFMRHRSGLAFQP
jgi:hypothetical protein